MKGIAEKTFVEEKLEEVFATLPDIIWNNPDTGLDESYSARFEFGDEMDINQFIREEDTPFPLIWLHDDYEEEGTEEGIDCDLTFILAINTKAFGMINKERLDTSFRDILTPLLQNVLKVFKRSNTVTLLDRNYKAKKFYNYGVKEFGDKKEKQILTTAIDAYRLTVQLKIFNNCLKTINYHG